MSNQSRRVLLRSACLCPDAGLRRELSPGYTPRMTTHARPRMRRATTVLAIALTAASPHAGCISYAAYKGEKASYRELAVTGGLAAVELGAGVLGGYAAEGGQGLGQHPMGLGESIMVMTAGILMVDAIVALFIYADI